MVYKNTAPLILTSVLLMSITGSPSYALDKLKALGASQASKILQGNSSDTSSTAGDDASNDSKRSQGSVANSAVNKLKHLGSSQASKILQGSSSDTSSTAGDGASNNSASSQDSVANSAIDTLKGLGSSQEVVTIIQSGRSDVSSTTIDEESNDADPSQGSVANSTIDTLKGLGGNQEVVTIIQSGHSDVSSTTIDEESNDFAQSEDPAIIHEAHQISDSIQGPLASEASENLHQENISTNDIAITLEDMMPTRFHLGGIFYHQDENQYAAGKAPMIQMIDNKSVVDETGSTTFSLPITNPGISSNHPEGKAPQFLMVTLKLEGDATKFCKAEGLATVDTRESSNIRVFDIRKNLPAKITVHYNATTKTCTAQGPDSSDAKSTTEKSETMHNQEAETSIE